VVKVDDSLVVLLRYHDASYVFVGDAEIENDSICRAEIPELIDVDARSAARLNSGVR
jgi:hypothetical protein